MRFSIDQKINTGLSLLLLILGAVGTIFYRNIVASAQAQWGMSRTYETQEQIRQVQLDFKRVEAGQRSHLVTQVDGDLFSYRTAVTRLGYDVDFLRSATAESPAQQGRLASPDYLLTRWVAILQQTMASKSKALNGPPPLVGAKSTKDAIYEINGLLLEMENEDNDVLRAHNQAAASTARNAAVLIVGGIAFAPLLAGDDPQDVSNPHFRLRLVKKSTVKTTRAFGSHSCASVPPFIYIFSAIPNPYWIKDVLGRVSGDFPMSTFSMAILQITRERIFVQKETCL